MPKHIQRLILVFAAILVIFLIIRKVLIPDSFGDFGHYRGLALDENKAIEAKYVGESICGDCHDDYMELKMSDLHAGISCETCHGPGWKHIDNPLPDQLIIPSGRDYCAHCHSLNPARPENFKQVNLKEHNPDADCAECHNPHAPWN